MDILTHTLSGVAVGTVTATISKSNLKQKSMIILTGGLGGAMPDIDAISFWSKFNQTFGTWFNLSHTGHQIYFAKFWYSHHGALHSLLAPSLLILISMTTTWVKNRTHDLSTRLKGLTKRKLYYSSFFLGYIVHLLEDMPTPSSVWGGVNLFFPSSNYIGGYGKIWWWNNYDIFILVVAIIVINLLLNFLPKRLRNIKQKSSLIFTSLLTVLIFYQISTRPISFAYTGHTSKYQSYETASQQIQQDILGKRIYTFMYWLDMKIPLNF